MAESLRVLIIEDSDDDEELLILALQESSYDFTSTRVQTAQEFTTAISEQVWDVILSDFSLPQFNAPMALKLLKNSGQDIPFIIVSGTIGEEVAVEAMRSGAADFFAKDNIVRLLPAIEREIREARERRLRRIAEARLQRKAHLEKLLQEVAIQANLASSVTHLFQLILDKICEYAALPVGHILMPSLSDPEQFVSSGLWHLDDPEQFSEFRSVSESLTFTSSGETQIGKVIESQGVVWLSDVNNRNNVGRSQLLKVAGIKSGFVFAALVESELAIILEFYSYEPLEEDDPLREFIPQITTQLSRVIERDRYTTTLEARVAERTAQLSEEKERIEAILNNSSDAIIFASFDGVIRQLNPAFSNLFGYSVDDMLGHSLLSLADPDDLWKFMDSLSTVVNEGKPCRLEIVGLRKDKTVFDADVTLAGIIQQGKVQGVVCGVRDITDRKQAEQEVRAALEKERELNELKTNFTSMVSHEFRTPLAVILSSVEIVRRYMDRLSEEKKEAHFEQIQTQVKRLVDLLDDVLALSRAESMEIKANAEALEMTEFCREIVKEIQQTTQNHQLDFSVQGAAHTVNIDRKLMRQAITNLLSNAVKYSPDGGDVIFRLVYRPEHIVIQVKDSGIGIPQSDLKRLFEAFHRAQNVGDIPGTGLGLPIVKRAVEAHGGTITVDTAPGIGTQFTITMPPGVGTGGAL